MSSSNEINLEKNPLAKKIDKILNVDFDQETVSLLKNVSELVPENNLNTRRNLRANIERQSLLINEQFIQALDGAYKNLQKLSTNVQFVDQTCEKMMMKIEELKFQTHDFLKQTIDINAELKKLDTNEKLLGNFCSEYQLTPNEVALIINAGGDNNNFTTSTFNVDDRFFEVLHKIKHIHDKAKHSLANKQHITGFEIMDTMSKYEEMANDKLYRWTLSILRTINLDKIELHSHLFKSIAYLQQKEILFKHCLEEYTTVRRSAVSHLFIEALTRGRATLLGTTQQHQSQHGTQHHQLAMERYSHDILRYIRDMLAFLHQTLVMEKDMLQHVLRLCDQQKLSSDKILQKILSAISEGVTRPLKIRVENSLINNNKSMLKISEKQNEKTKCYFLVKNVINFYLQTFRQLLLEEAPFVQLIKELLIMSDKVFYNSLNFYCSSSIAQKVGGGGGGGGGTELDRPKPARMSLNTSEHLGEYVQLVRELLEVIKSSMAANAEEEQQLETHRILSTMIEPFMQYVIIYSSKLTPIEMTVFSYNCAHVLHRTIVRYKFTDEFCKNLSKQLYEYVEVLINEQLQHLINSLSAASLYNAFQQCETLAAPMCTFSGCDHMAVSTFLKLWDKFINDPRSYQFQQLANINDSNTREQVWHKSLQLICNVYQVIYQGLIDPKNQYTNVVPTIKYTSEKVTSLLLGGGGGGNSGGGSSDSSSQQ